MMVLIKHICLACVLIGVVVSVAVGCRKRSESAVSISKELQCVRSDAGQDILRKIIEDFSSSRSLSPKHVNDMKSVCEMLPTLTNSTERSVLFGRLVETVLNMGFPDIRNATVEEVTCCAERLCELHESVLLASCKIRRDRFGDVDFKLAIVGLYDDAIKKCLKAEHKGGETAVDVDEGMMIYSNTLRRMREMWISMQIDMGGYFARDFGEAPVNRKKDILRKIRKAIGRYPRWYADEIKEGHE